MRETSGIVDRKIVISIVTLRYIYLSKFSKNFSQKSAKDNINFFLTLLIKKKTVQADIAGVRRILHVRFSPQSPKF